MGERRNVAIVHRRHARHAVRRAAGMSRRRRSVIGPDLSLHSLARFLAKADEGKTILNRARLHRVDIAIARHELTTNWRHLPSQTSGTRLL